MDKPIPKPGYVFSEPHLSGWRVILGFATMAEANAAHDALVGRESSREANNPTPPVPLEGE